MMITKIHSCSLPSHFPSSSFPLRAYQTRRLQGKVDRPYKARISIAKCLHNIRIGEEWSHSPVRTEPVLQVLKFVQINTAVYTGIICFSYIQMLSILMGQDQRGTPAHLVTLIHLNLKALKE